MRARARRDERGVTLIEAMVTVFVLSIVSVGFFSSFQSAERTSDGINQRLQHLGEAQKLMRAATKDIRTATSIQDGQSPFLIAKEREMTFYANLGTAAGFTAPVKVTLSVNTADPEAPTLIETTQEANNPTATPLVYGTKPIMTRFIGTYLFNNAAEPIFTYKDVNGTVLVATGTGLSATDKMAVRSIAIKMKVKKSRGRPIGATTLQNTVRLPNVIYGVAPST